MTCKSISFLFLTFLICFSSAFSQVNGESESTPNRSTVISQPFLFAVTTLTDENRLWSINYSGSYGERVSGPFGYDGVGQGFAVTGYLGDRFTLYAKASFGFAGEGEDISTAQQAEVIRDFIGGKKNFGFRLGAGLGLSRDYEGVGALFSRLTTSYENPFWRANVNLVFEKAFSSDRDAIDVTTSIGIQYQVFNNLFAGIEAISEDLEGLWEDDEAEGGAKVFIGPSINLSPSKSRFTFALAGGPVINAVQSSAIPSEAIRQLPFKNGFTVRGMVIFDLSGNLKI